MHRSVLTSGSKVKVAANIKLLVAGGTLSSIALSAFTGSLVCTQGEKGTVAR